MIPFDELIKWRVAGGYNSYLVNSNCECCMVFRDLLFNNNTSYGSKTNEMREF
jgi:hypothetical protein